MEDIAVNTDFYDLFSRPFVSALIVLWLSSVAAARYFGAAWSRRIALGGLGLVFVVSSQPVLYTADQLVPELIDQTKVNRAAGSADSLRERDPIFRLFQVYVELSPAYPLAVINDPDGEALRWARYYLHPRGVVRATAEGLADTAPRPKDPPRYALSRGSPALPAGVNIFIEARHEDWLLFKVQR
jgi:hypothetical protein